MLTIGEFSKLGHISPRMLRHYDRLGLLCPDSTGPENGYRYYAMAQLKALANIETLKRYGFTLAEVKALLPLPKEALAQRIQQRMRKAGEELEELRKTMRQMEADLRTMEESVMNNEHYPVLIMEEPAQRVFGIRKRIRVSETHALFETLKAEMERRGLRRAGATQLVCLDAVYNPESLEVEAQAQVAGDSPDIREIPARLCAVTRHIGPYTEVHFAYSAIGAWLADHPEYRVCGNAVERYLTDEQSASSPELYETGVLVPVERVP